LNIPLNSVVLQVLKTALRVKIVLHIILFLSLSGQCLAQVDSSYIRSYDNKFMLMGFLVKEFVFLAVETPQQELMYMPNNPTELGLGFSWNNTVLSFAYGYGFDFMRDKKLGKTKSFDFQLHDYGRKFVFDLFVQSYKGFYMEDEKTKSEYVLCPDLKVRQFGVNGEYIFNNKRFSYKAAFNQSEKQLRSAGSLLLGLGVYFSDIQSDSSFIYNNRNDLKNFQFGVSVGYAYTWVLGKRWHITAAATTGINFGSETIGRFGKDRLEVYPTVLPRFGAAYNHDTWALGFSFIGNLNFPNFTDDETLGLFAGNFKMTYYKRIADIPFLSKLF